jgi:hypothetical protein
MKIILTLSLYLISSTVFASMNEIECDGTNKTKMINLEVEQPFPSNSVFKRVNLSISDDNTQENFKYTATTSRFGLRTILYQGADLRLEVDLWPDSEPRWGRNYQAILNSFEINEGSGLYINCQFPNAN